MNATVLLIKDVSDFLLMVRYVQHVGRCAALFAIFITLDFISSAIKWQQMGITAILKEIVILCLIFNFT